jgi:pyruvate dehydrogenase E2 component (dihydrolipoamide acetyltransferase)
MTDVIMPRLSDSMEEGTILKWLKAAGDEVRVGEPIAEIETDKATMTYEADAAGFLAPVAGEGDTLAIGSVIARLEPDRATALAEETPTAVAGNGAGAPDASDATADDGGAVAAAAPAGTPGPAAEAAPAAAAGRVRASPVARRIARELGVDLAALVGTGPEGRIVKADVVAASEHSGAATAAAPAAQTAAQPQAPAPPPPPAAPPAPAAQPPAAPPAPPAAPPAAQPVPTVDAAPADASGAKGTVEVVEPNRIQQLIARRMASAKATIPEFQVTVDVDAEAAFELREQLRGHADPLPSINDFVIKACALALRVHPRVNGSYVDGHFEYYGRVNIGMAVATEGSLVVPTIFDADTRSLTDIAAATRTLAGKVRDGKVSPPELAGATFTVSNLGMLGVSRFTAVINPPQAAIVAVGAASPRAVVAADGTVSARRVMELTISADHRIVYGADAADFLGTVRRRLERPVTLLL